MRSLGHSRRSHVRALVSLIMLIILTIAVVSWVVRPGMLLLSTHLALLALGLGWGVFIGLYTQWLLMAGRSNDLPATGGERETRAHEARLLQSAIAAAEGRMKASAAAEVEQRVKAAEERMKASAAEVPERLRPYVKAVVQEQLASLALQLDRVSAGMDTVRAEMHGLQDQLGELHAANRLRLKAEVAKASDELRDLQRRSTQGLDARGVKTLQVLLELVRRQPVAGSALLSQGVAHISEAIGTRSDLRAVKEMVIARTRIDQLVERLEQLQHGLAGNRMTSAECATELQAIRGQMEELPSLPNVEALGQTLPAGMTWVRNSLLQEIEAEYLGIVNKGSPSGDVGILKEILKQLGLQLVDIELNRTLFDRSKHRSNGVRRVPGVAPGVIVSVVTMGIKDVDSGEVVSPAQVFISE